MGSRNSRSNLLMLAALVGLSACGTEATDSETNSSQPTATATAEATAQATESALPSATPTATATALPTAIVTTPTATDTGAATHTAALTPTASSTDTQAGTLAPTLVESTPTAAALTPSAAGTPTPVAGTPTLVTDTLTPVAATPTPVTGTPTAAAPTATAADDTPTLNSGTPFVVPAGLVINEIMSANDSVIMNSYEDFSDWIEIYNGSDSTINLNGYLLSDNLEEPGKWSFPEVVIEAGSYLLIWASDDEPTETELHANFKLKSDGEPVILSTPDGQVVDQIEAMEIPEDISYGRSVDGGIDFVLFSAPSPGAANGGNIYVPPEETAAP